MESCIGTVAFCPMLSILFVGTRMRALQMTNNKGAPQGWAQDGMYLATWSIFLQFWMVVLASVFLGSKATTDKDGTVPVVGDQLAGPPPGAGEVVPGMEPGGAAGDVMAPVGAGGDVMKTAGDTATDPAGAVSF